MSSRQKRLLFAFVGVVLLGLLLAPYLGEARNLEIKYPKLPGMENRLTSKSSLSDYLSYLYYFAVNIIGITAFVVLVVGGIGYLTAAGSLEKTKKARKQLIGGGTGLLLVLGTFLILKTINPQLLILQPPDVTTLHGVCLYSNQGEDNEEEHCFTENTTKIVPEDFYPDKIEFYGLNSEFYQIFLFPEEDYRGDFLQAGNHRKSYNDLPAGLPLNWSPKSIYFDNHESGVFLFPNEGADYNQDSFKNFPNNLPMVLKGPINNMGNFKTKSLQIRYSYHKWDIAVSTPEHSHDSHWPDAYFGTILHREVNGGGQCGIVYQGGEIPSVPGIWTRKVKKLQDLDIHAINQVRSVDVFSREFQKDLEGDVTFYEELDFGGKSYTVPASEIQGGDESYFWQTTIQSYPWHGLERIYSIKVDGNYWVVLNNNRNWTKGCQLFPASTKDLKSSYVLSLTTISEAKIWSIAIIPIRPSLE